MATWALIGVLKLLLSPTPRCMPLLIPHSHHLVFPLGAAHTRDLLVKELDGIVHACRQGTALIQEAKIKTPYV